MTIYKELAQRLVMNASDSALTDAVRLLRTVHGDSFATQSEAEVMYRTPDHARDVLYNTGYFAELYAYFTGYRDGGARGSSGLLVSEELLTHRLSTDVDAEECFFCGGLAEHVADCPTLLTELELERNRDEAADRTSEETGRAF